MANGKSLQDLRNLSAELEKKRKSEEIKRKNNLISERKNLVHSAVSRKKSKTKNQQKAARKSFYLGHPVFISVLILLGTGIILTVIFSGNDAKKEKTSASIVLKQEIPLSSETYSQVSCYVRDIINRTVNRKFEETATDIWHQNAAPEARYYSILRLSEMHASPITTVRKIYHYEGYNCYFCVCAQENSKHDLVVKVAMENSELKLVAVE